MGPRRLALRLAWDFYAIGGEEPNPPTPFPKREGGARLFSPLPAAGRGGGGVRFFGQAQRRRLALSPAHAQIRSLRRGYIEPLGLGLPQYRRADDPLLLRHSAPLSHRPRRHLQTA